MTGFLRLRFFRHCVFGVAKKNNLNLKYFIFFSKCRRQFRGKVGSDGFEKVLIGTRGARETLLQGRKVRAALTTICITHHLGDLKTSDDVIYLDAGHIVEHGSFDELMKAKGTFYQQVNARGED